MKPSKFLLDLVPVKLKQQVWVKRIPYMDSRKTKQKLREIPIVVWEMYL